MRSLVALPSLVPLFLVLSAASSARGDPVQPAVREFFEKADRVEVVSIDPAAHRAWGSGAEKDPSPLATWRTALNEADGVFGRVDLTSEERAPVLKALFDGMAAAPTPAAGCYDPRHAVVAHKGTGTDEQVAAIHVCFACNWVVVLDATTAAGKEEHFADVGGLNSLLNRILMAAKIPLAADVAKARESEKPLEAAALEKALSARARRVLEAPDALELVALEVGPGVWSTTPATPAKSALAAWLESSAEGKKVRGRVALTRPSAIRGLAEQVRRELVQSATRTCWNPRHALVVSRGADKVVLILCFECMAAQVIDVDGESDIQPFAASASLKRRLNEILVAHGVEPAPETGHLPPEGPPTGK